MLLRIGNSSCIWVLSFSAWVPTNTILSWYYRSRGKLQQMSFPLKRKRESSLEPAGGVASSSNNLERGEHKMRGRTTGRCRGRGCGRGRGRSFHIPRNASKYELLTEVWKHRTHSPYSIFSQSGPVPPSSPPSHSPPSPAPQPQPDEITKAPQLLHGSTKATRYHNPLASIPAPCDTSNVGHQPDPSTKQNVRTKPPHRKQKGTPSALISVPMIHTSSAHVLLNLQPVKDLFDQDATGHMVTPMTHLSASEDVNDLLDTDPFTHPKSAHKRPAQALGEQGGGGSKSRYIK